MAKAADSRPEKIRLVCISDTHNHAPGEGYKLPAGDILIHAGDLTNQGGQKEMEKAATWLQDADYAIKIVVAGNHDLCLDPNYHLKYADGWTVMPTASARSRELLRTIPDVTYLKHESVDVEIRGKPLRVFGSPYSMDRGSQNWAFQYPPSRGAELWSAIPRDTDILVTHTPAQGLLDESTHWPDGGCPALRKALSRVRPAVHVCGHHHEGRGVLFADWSGQADVPIATQPWHDPGQGSKKQSLVSLVREFRDGQRSAIVNASIMKTSWTASSHKAWNKPIVIDIPAC